MQFLKVNSIDFFSSIAVSFFIKVFKHRPFKIHMFKKCVTVYSLVQFLKDNSTIFTIITAHNNSTISLYRWTSEFKSLSNWQLEAQRHSPLNSL